MQPEGEIYGAVAQIAEILAVGRMVERLAIVMFGGVSIYFGWQLFLKGVVLEQAGNLEGRGFKVTLQKVGPGTFFGLFGTFILLFSLFSPIKIQPTADAVMGTQISALAPRSNESTDLRYARSLNTFINFELPDKPAELSQSMIRDWKLAKPSLVEIRNAIAGLHFSNQDLKTGLSLLTPDGFDRERATPEQLRVLDKLEPWLVETVASESKQ